MTKNTDKRVAKIGNRTNHPKTGRWKHTEESKEKNRQSHLGRPSPKKEKTYEEYYGPDKAAEVKLKLVESYEGYVCSEETKEKLRLAAKKTWLDSEFVQNWVAAVKLKPTKPEIVFGKLLQEYFSEQYKYVGDFKLFIGGRCPDFIHTSKKLIIELFGDYWHSEEKTGIPEEQHMNERIEHFDKYNYKTLVVWEHELIKITELIDKVREFTNG